MFDFFHFASFLKKCVITKKAHKKTTVMPGKSPTDSSPFSLFIFTILTHHVPVQSRRQASYCTDTNRLFPLYSRDTGNRRPDLCMSPDSALITFSYLPKGYDLLRLICRVLSGFGEISRILRAGYLLILKNAPSLQWRDRAGFSPASILAIGSFAACGGSGSPKEHKLFMYFSYRQYSIDA